MLLVYTSDLILSKFYFPPKGTGKKSLSKLLFVLSVCRYTANPLLRLFISLLFKNTQYVPWISTRPFSPLPYICLYRITTASALNSLTAFNYGAKSRWGKMNDFGDQGKKSFEGPARRKYICSSVVCGIGVTSRRALSDTLHGPTETVIRTTRTVLFRFPAWSCRQDSSLSCHSITDGNGDRISLGDMILFLFSPSFSIICLVTFIVSNRFFLFISGSK